MTDFFKLPGAVLDEVRGVPAHYGSPLREQRVLDDGRAIVDLSYIGVLTVTGADRLTWIDSMTSGLVRTLQSGQSRETMLLSPTGQIECVARVFDTGDKLFLLVERDLIDDFALFLKKMRFAMRVEITDESDIYAVIGARGNAAVFLANRADFVWRDPWAQVLPGGVQYAIGADYADYDFLLALVKRDDIAGLLDAATAENIGVSGADSVQGIEIMARRPSVRDLDERALPHEFDWLRTAVHLQKGCYRGQETVAKVHNLGHPPRRLTLLHLDGSDVALPESGALIYQSPDVESRPVGRITRAAMHYEWGPVAFALLKRTVPEDATLWVQAQDEIISATQETIVPPDAGQAVNIPHELRRSQAQMRRKIQ